MRKILRAVEAWFGFWLHVWSGGAHYTPQEKMIVVKDVKVHRQSS